MYSVTPVFKLFCWRYVGVNKNNHPVTCVGGVGLNKYLLTTT